MAICYWIPLNKRSAYMSQGAEADGRQPSYAETSAELLDEHEVVLGWPSSFVKT